ncbi:MAG TPA: hypothetical protein DCE41_30325 [Cytophagales bacterium]|nr:hypothetical protein [Cytophagales bacterium]HAA20386.1 hypothetical protein [Cytophagales bacterium]HAP62140.1 hypothetical protein [Cytophagales bacterium]
MEKHLLDHSHEVNSDTFGIAYLAEAAAHLLDFDHQQEDLFGYIALQIKAISGATFVAVNTHEESQYSTLKSLMGLPKPLQKLAEKTGHRSKNFRVHIPRETLDFLTRGELHRFTDLYELSLGSVPKSVCKTAEMLFPFGEIYMVGFTRREQVFGGSALVFKKGKTLQNEDLLVAFAKLAATAIKSYQTESKLQQTEALYRHLFDHGMVGVYRSNQAGEIQLANPELFHMFGYDTLEEFQQKRAIDLYSNRAVRAEYIQQMEAKGFVKMYENTGLTKQGKTIHFLETAKKIVPNNGDKPYYDGIVVDLTQLKEMQLRLNELVSRQSHDLRRPLTTMMGLVDLLLSNPTDEERAKYLKHIRTTSDELDEVVHSLVAMTALPE